MGVQGSLLSLVCRSLGCLAMSLRWVSVACMQAFCPGLGSCSLALLKMNPGLVD